MGISELLLFQVNKLTVWEYTNEFYTSDDVEDPYLLSSVSHEGDIMDIRWDQAMRHLFVGDSKGDISMLNLNAEKVNFESFD